MFREEKMIDGMLAFRITPDGEWTYYTKADLSRMLADSRLRTDRIGKEWEITVIQAGDDDEGQPEVVFQADRETIARFARLLYQPTKVIILSTEQEAAP